MNVFAPRRILVIRFFFIGDVLLTTPLLCALKKRFPHCEITFLTDGVAAEVLTGHFAIDELLQCRPVGWKHFSSRKKQRHIGRLVRALRRRKFDLAINLQPGDRGGLWSVFSGARLRAGYAREGERMFYYNRTLPFAPKKRPRVEHMMDALRALDIKVSEDSDERLLRLPSMTISPEESHFAQQFLAEKGWNENAETPLVAIHAGRPNTRKTWPDERFAALADELIHRYSARIVWLGAPEETARAAKIQALMTEKARSISTAGKFNLKETGALLQRCRLFIGIDSGPMHIASSVDTPTVSLFGFSDASVWQPRDLRGETRHVALQKPLPDAPCQAPQCCEPGQSPCMLRISVDEVAQAAARFIQND